MKPKTGGKLMKKKREKTQITNIRKERDIVTDPKDILKRIRKC